MNLDYSEEQRLLKDSVDRFVAQRYDFATRQKYLQAPARFSPEIWRQMAEFGWLALPLPEEHGGLGGSAIDVGILMEGFGRALLLEPYLSSVVLGGGLITQAGTPEQQARWLPALAEGKLRLAFAHGEPGVKFGEGPLQTSARRESGGWRLQGAKSMVLDAPGADHLIVSASIARDQEGAAGTALFVLPARTNGLAMRSFEILDGRLAGNLTLDGVRVDDAHWLGASQDNTAAIDHVVDHALSALAYEALGCMQTLLDLTEAYTRTRVQFGQPIVANQVLKHRMVEMAVQCEEARSMAMLAALRSSACPAERASAASGAKLKIGRGGRFVAEQAVQLHGAMGVTEELNIGAYFKRLMVFEMVLGTASWHQRRRFAQVAAESNAA